ncbi:MAG: hypothetical protein P3X22_002805 [Thermoprotei archaeon]|nr:hypothetical protein [Thermoprotei archaeon]
MPGLHGLTYAFKVALRRPTVFLCLATLIALSTVVSITMLASEYPKISRGLLAAALAYGSGISYSEGLPCEGVVKANNLELSVNVVALEKESKLWEFLKLKPPGEGSAFLGYWVASSLKVKPGDTITIFINGTPMNVTVRGSYRVNNILDTMILLGGSLDSCSSLYELGEHNPSVVMGALSTQLSESLVQWYFVSLAALAVASLLSTYKALRDLKPEVEKLEAQGLPKLYVIVALSLSTATLIFIGASYGLVIFDIIVSATSSYMGLYMPTPGVSHNFALKAIAAPAMAALTASTLAGVIAWRNS